MEKWSLNNLPPPKHPDVGKFIWSLVMDARDYREEQGVTRQWLKNYEAVRGDHFRGQGGKESTTINLVSANIKRKQANLVSGDPALGITTTDGIDEALGREIKVETITTQRLGNWWRDTVQSRKMWSSVGNFLTYGPTIEKYVWDATRWVPGVTICDPFSILYAPGVWEDISFEAPYVVHLAAPSADWVEETFGVKCDDDSQIYDILGECRHEIRRSGGSEAASTTGYYNFGDNSRSGNTVGYKPRFSGGAGAGSTRALIAEVWVRDNKKDNEGLPIYPGGLRCITVTNNGKTVISDRPNPSMNISTIRKYADRVAQAEPWLWRRMPFTMGGSIHDSFSTWPYSEVEETAALNYHFDNIMSKMLRYMYQSMHPALILPRDCNIGRSQLSSKGIVIIRPPTAAHAQGIRYLRNPGMSSDNQGIMDWLIRLFDRIYAIEDVDRGQVPGSIRSGSAISALQEKNAIVMKSSIRTVDYLTECRGRAALSLWQMFGAWRQEAVEAGGEMVPFSGEMLLGRKFDVRVDSSSALAETQAQKDAKWMELYQTGIVSREVVLDQLAIPNKKEIMEKLGETQVDRALQDLMQAGAIGQEEAMAIKNNAGIVQQGQSQAKAPQPGVPRADQGLTPNQQT